MIFGFSLAFCVGAYIGLLAMTTVRRLFTRRLGWEARLFGSTSSGKGIIVSLWAWNC